MKTKVVFFGSIGLAKRILDEIVLKKNIELVGVCCEELNNTWRTDESVYEYCKKKNIPILADNEVVDAKADLGISVRYNRIIRDNVISSFRLGIVNTHGGILPEYRGSYCNINAIINNEKEYGVTLHYIDKGVDSGDVVAIKKTDILPTHTGFDLYQISEKFCYELIEENIDALLEGTNYRITQDNLIAQGHICNTYKAKSTIALKQINPLELDEKAIRIVRAFDSDSHEPAFCEIGGTRIYLRSKF